MRLGRYAKLFFQLAGERGWNPGARLVLANRCNATLPLHLRKDRVPWNLPQFRLIAVTELVQGIPEILLPLVDFPEKIFRSCIGLPSHQLRKHPLLQLGSVPILGLQLTHAELVHDRLDRARTAFAPSRPGVAILRRTQTRFHLVERRALGFRHHRLFRCSARLRLYIVRCPLCLQLVDLLVPNCIRRRRLRLRIVGVAEFTQKSPFMEPSYAFAGYGTEALQREEKTSRSHPELKPFDRSHETLLNARIVWVCAESEVLDQIRYRTLQLGVRLHQGIDRIPHKRIAGIESNSVCTTSANHTRSRPARLDRSFPDSFPDLIDNAAEFLHGLRLA